MPVRITLAKPLSLQKTHGLLQTDCTLKSRGNILLLSVLIPIESHYWARGGQAVFFEPGFFLFSLLQAAG